MQAELVRAGLEYGFTAEELGTVYDWRMIPVLLDAAQARRARQQRPQPGVPAPNAPAAANDNKKVWPGAQRNMGVALGAVRRAEERLNKEGSIEAAVAALQARRGVRRR